MSEALQAGFALAATIARDAGAKRAHIGIAASVADAWCGLARDLERASKAERRARIRELTRIRSTDGAGSGRPDLSPRALALLSGRHRAASGTRATFATRVALGPGTMPRAGFAADPELLDLLHRIARRAGTP